MSELAIRVVDAEFIERDEGEGRIKMLVRRLRQRKLYEFVESVAERYGVTVDMIMSRDRHSSVAAARHAVCYALRYDLPDRELSYPEIGRILDRDHSTVMSSVKTFAANKTRCLRHPPLLARTRPKPAFLLQEAPPESALPDIPDLILPESAESAVA
jgi:hypothetical protein